MRGAALLLAAALTTAVPASQDNGPSIAVTIDDLPALGPWPEVTDRVEIARKDVAALRAAGAGKVYGFVNHAVAERIPATAQVLQVWRDAGLPLANHGWSHADLHTVGAAAFIADIARNEPYMAALTGANDWHWFRYPYLRTGTDPAQRLAVRQELAKRGYRIADVTMSFEDYLWNPPYARCVAAGDQAAIAELERSYLAAASDAARASRSQAQAVYGRDIPYVLLIHIGTFTSRMLPRLLAQYKQEGFHFVTLPQAESDPAYANDIDPALPATESLANRTAALSTVYHSPDYGKTLAAMCQPTPAGQPSRG